MIRYIYVKSKTKIAIPHIRRSLIRDAMLQAARKCATDAYLNSQEYVPVLSGQNSKAKNRRGTSYGYERNRISISRRDREPGALRSSGNIIDTPDGVNVEYKEKYASYVEGGTRPRSVKVRGYYFSDEGKLAGVYVPPHMRNMPGNTPRDFIGDTMKLHFEKLADTFNERLETNFRS